MERELVQASVADIENGNGLTGAFGQARERNGKCRAWHVASGDPQAAEMIAADLGVSKYLGMLLVNRGFDTPEKAASFLNARLTDMYDPFLMKDMERAVERILAAVKSRERIIIYGDYDVDGITSITVLLTILRRMGADVDFYIPRRIEEGYGLHKRSLLDLKERGASLVVTVDCGISAKDEVEYAREIGLDVVVTDHHEPPESLPELAAAVVNPKRPGCGYPFKELAGVGVAFKLAQALVVRSSGREYSPRMLGQLLDLVALGTIADIVPLVGENRIIAKYGLYCINNTANTGIRALAAVAGLGERKLSADSVAYGLAPRLNAAGRVGDPDLAVELLLSPPAERAKDLALILERMNRERQKIEKCIYDEAVSIAEDARYDETGRILVISGNDWHTGVIGIVASKLVERFYKPVVLISVTEGEGRGSARSIPGFDLYTAISSCSGLLKRFGGHEQAAGLEIDPEMVGDFREELNRYAAENMEPGMLVPRIEADMELGMDEISLELAKEIQLMEPFGQGNPPPLFAATGLPLLEYRGVGEDSKHLQLTLGSYENPISAIAFRMGGCCDDLFKWRIEEIDAIFALEVNEWRDRLSLQMNIKDMKYRLSTQGAV